MTTLVPEGWQRDELWFGVVLTWPGHGFVTISEKKRGYELGHGSIVYAMPGYTGRGWKERLYADAIAALKKADQGE